MSTHSSITAKMSDGNYKSIYCHSDGFTWHNGKILLEHFTEQSKIDSLLNLGNLSYLQPSIDCPDGHSFDHPVDGYTIAYTRDRQEHQDQLFSVGQTAQQALDQHDYGQQAYNYIWDGTQWLVNNIPLTPQMCIRG